MELRAVGSDKVVGTVEFEDGVLTLAGAAGDAFAALRRHLGDQRLGEDLVANGWSNGYLYLA
ncbi:MAG TPA: hypothetical protein VF174_15640 [Micromonosporaceae bacterium]